MTDVGVKAGEGSRTGSFVVVVVVVVVVIVSLDLPRKEANGDSTMRQSSSIGRIPAVGHRVDGGRVVFVVVVLDVDVDVDIVEIAATVWKSWIAAAAAVAAADIYRRGLSDWNCGDQLG